LEATRERRPQLGLKARLDTWPSWAKIGDTTPYRGHTDQSVDDLELGLDPK